MGRRGWLLGMLGMVMPGLGGLQPPPQNSVPAGTLVPGVQPGVSAPVVRARQVIVSGSGEGVYVYQSGTKPMLGNPPVFWAGSSPDPYGNTLPATAGVAGTGTFAAGDTLITPAGTLIYSGTPAAGNLIASSAGAGFTDSFGNAGVPGVASYSGSGSSWTATSLAGGGFGAGVNFYTASSAGGPWTRQATLDYAIPDSGIAVSATAFILDTTVTQLINTGVEIPTSSAGITTVAELVTALTNVGIF